MKDKFRVAYTAAVSKGNPGVGGYAFTAESRDGAYSTRSGACSYSTGNCMKLRAVLAAVEHMVDNAMIYTDSTYVVQGAQTWRHDWKTKRWRNSSGKKIQNIDLWKLLDAKLTKRPTIKIRYLKSEMISAQKIALEAAETAAATRAWSHRLGPALTIPLLVNADIRLARTSGYNWKFVSAFLRAANKKPNGGQQTWLECCDKNGSHAFHLLADHGFKPLQPDELPGLPE